MAATAAALGEELTPDMPPRIFTSFRTLGPSKLSFDVAVGTAWRVAHGLSTAAVKITCSFPRLYLRETFEELRCDACANAPIVVVQPAECVWSECVELPLSEGQEHYHYTARVSCPHGTASDVGDVVLALRLAGSLLVSPAFRVAPPARRTGRPPGPRALARIRARALERARSARATPAPSPPSTSTPTTSSSQLTVKVSVVHSPDSPQRTARVAEEMGSEVRALVPWWVVGSRCAVVPAGGGAGGSVVVVVEAFSDPSAPGFVQSLVEWHQAAGTIPPGGLTLHESVTSVGLAGGGPCASERAAGGAVDVVAETRARVAQLEAATEQRHEYFRAIALCHTAAPAIAHMY
eukprot:m51a1_g11674 hypothetical protein (350) ;mRNA; f:3032-6260